MIINNPLPLLSFLIINLKIFELNLFKIILEFFCTLLILCTRTHQYSLCICHWMDWIHYRLHLQVYICHQGPRNVYPHILHSHKPTWFHSFHQERSKLHLQSHNLYNNQCIFLSDCSILYKDYWFGRNSHLVSNNIWKCILHIFHCHPF